MALRVNTNRMELLRLKRRLAIARRGHRLLKDKLEELVRRLLALSGDIRSRRREVSARMVAGQRAVMAETALLTRGQGWSAIAGTAPVVTLAEETQQILNFQGPRIDLSFGKGAADPTAGGPGLNRIAAGTEGLLRAIVELATRERWVEILAGELIKTRRRVNALEHVVIPELEEAIKRIAMSLAEQERSTIVRLMKIKDLLASQEAGRSRGVPPA